MSKSSMSTQIISLFFLINNFLQSIYWLGFGFASRRVAYPETWEFKTSPTHSLQHCSCFNYFWKQNWLEVIQTFDLLVYIFEDKINNHIQNPKFFFVPKGLISLASYNHKIACFVGFPGWKYLVKPRLIKNSQY